MNAFHAIVAAISLWMARIGGLMLVGSSVVITMEILARKVIHIPFSVGTELSSYALAISASWAFSYALLNRAHVRIDVIRNWTPPLSRFALDVLAFGALGAVALIMAWFAWDTVDTSWTLGARENTSLGTLLVIPQGLWFVGLVWFAFVCVEQLALVALALMRGDRAAAAAMVTTPDVADEIEEALDAVDAQPVIQR
ncbi:TRAP-type mannitol/chloroaromatic compound transport system permease small subunit [Bosea sp. AK1]|uniref:TRAP transporter small permease subunit n=1 Tax=Bosea sp. AK1 TaxID=2587160 RepID=UPI001150BC4F|nr:TRAP transporter small permease [Bosea sp. AK1]TQI75377.1 TRAP-type mannitol/chloroaromatic compound transport system permease small subunit [Bosea sp. AK1]